MILFPNFVLGIFIARHKLVHFSKDPVDRELNTYPICRNKDWTKHRHTELSLIQQLRTF